MTMQSEAMRRSGVLAAPMTIQSEAMRRSGVLAAPATMQSEAMSWGFPRSGGGRRW
jgi:hypothetical protein